MVGAARRRVGCPRSLRSLLRLLTRVVPHRQALYVGISDTPAWKVSQANTLATLRGWTPFIGLSTQYSLVERTAERDLLPMCVHRRSDISALNLRKGPCALRER